MKIFQMTLLFPSVIVKGTGLMWKKQIVSEKEETMCIYGDV